MDDTSHKHWHHIAADSVAALLDTDVEKGLHGFDAAHRLSVVGPNAITQAKKRSVLKMLLSQVNNALIYILIGSGIVAAILGEYVDSSVIFGVVIVNAIIGFIQEFKAEAALESLKKIVTTESIVIRDGQRIKIASTDIVPGDIVALSSGDKVPADVRIVSCRDLAIDESQLTGESVSVAKSAEAIAKDAVLPDRVNMAHAGSFVTYGHGIGIVVATGDNTELGNIAHLIAEVRPLDTPLTRKLSHFSRTVLYIILALAGVTFAVGVMRHEGAAEMFIAAIALAVGAIPEGLPAAVTITLAIGVSRMSRRKAIVRSLPAVETLGSTTVICSDKTGTLTENQMTVQKIYAGGNMFNVVGTGYASGGRIDGDASSAALSETLLCGALCNDASIALEDGIYSVHGDPTEGALIVSAERGGVDIKSIREKMPRIDAIPFESDRQYMATLNGDWIYVKGSVEKVIARCTDAMSPGGGTLAIDTHGIKATAERLAGEGLRVLCMARKQAGGKNSLSHDDAESGLTFLGLQAMMDPPRQDAVAAVRACIEAGISVKMITGDHALTAKMVAKAIGLSVERPGSIVTGHELAKMTDAELVSKIDDVVVFARVAPEQKLRLVDALQSKGHIVAMTGDGVNDAPALKQADIGIAMGKTGTEVAKETAAMILLDDRFSTIEAAVEEGRGVFDNLMKFIVWTLPTNMAEGFVILAAIFAGTVLPILPRQILWINMTTAVLLGLMLAFEPNEPYIMRRRPRNPKSRLMTAALVERILLTSVILLAGAFGLFWYELNTGASAAYARTVAVNAFVVMQTFYLFNCRSFDATLVEIGLFSNTWVLVGSGIMLFLQMLFTYTGFMNRIFDTEPLGLHSWLFIIAAGVIGFAIITLEKILIKRGRFPACKFS
jgi:Ca2+-transporting ATPase